MQTVKQNNKIEVALSVIMKSLLLLLSALFVVNCEIKDYEDCFKIDSISCLQMQVWNIVLIVWNLFLFISKLNLCDGEMVLTNLSLKVLFNLREIMEQCVDFNSLKVIENIIKEKLNLRNILFVIAF